MRTLRFSKMHGLGNDFVVVDRRREPVALFADDVRRLGDRHRGVGFDQLALIEASDAADVKLTFYNPDGGEAGACGNATRCVADLVLRERGAETVCLATQAGTLSASKRPDGRIEVLMAPPRFAWRDVPLAREADTGALDLGHGLPPAVVLSVGNPHAVLFIEDLDALDVERLGALLERHPLFPERANVGFAQVVGAERIRLRVFERGAGPTLACGSGACAALVAAVRRGLVEERAVMVLDGGELEVAWPGEGPVAMTGPVAYAFEGVLDLDALAGAP